MLVPRGVTLTVKPGTLVELSGYFLQVDGALVARGEHDKLIIIQNSQPVREETQIRFTGQSESWNDEKQSGSILEYVKFTTINESSLLYIKSSGPMVRYNTFTQLGGRVRYDAAIFVHSQYAASIPLTISSNEILGFQTGIYLFDAEPMIVANRLLGVKGGLDSSGAGIVCHCPHERSPRIERNLIQNYRSGIAIDSLSGSAKATIVGNTILSNVRGISVEGNATLSVFKGNSIENNQEYNFATGRDADVIATNNWWGTTDRQVIEAKLYHYPSDFRLGHISFDPFLTKPPDGVPTPFDSTTTPR
jgi:nitrous oxidase accessory protein NosD